MSWLRRLVWFGAALPAVAGDLSFTLAGLRLTPKRWDKQANFAKLEHYARQAAAQGAQVIVPPEGFLEGYVGNENQNRDLTRERYLEVGEPLQGEYLKRACQLARQLRVHLIFTFAYKAAGEQMRNSAAVIDPEGRIVSLYSKTHTADDEPFNVKGDEFPVVDTPHGRWGTLICMDRQLPETSRILAIKGAQIIFVPAWGMNNETNEIMMRTRAYENGVWVAFVHPQRVLIIDPAGKIAAQDHGAGDEIVFATIRLDGRVGRGPIRHRRPEIYGEILKNKP